MENDFGMEATDERWAPIIADVVTPALDEVRYKLHTTIAAPVEPQKRTEVHRSLCVGALVSAKPKLYEKLDEGRKRLKRILGEKRLVKPMRQVILNDSLNQMDLFYKEYCEVAGFFLCKNLIAKWETLEILPPNDEMTTEDQENYRQYEGRVQALAKLLEEGSKRRDDMAKKKAADKLAGIVEPADSDDEEKVEITTMLYVYQDHGDEEEEDSSAESTSNVDSLTKEIRALRRNFRNAAIRPINGGIPPEIFNHPEAKLDKRRYTRKEVAKQYNLALHELVADDSSDEEGDRRTWRVVAVPFDPDEQDQPSWEKKKKRTRRPRK